MKIEDLSEELQNVYHKYVMPVDTNIELDSVILSADNKSKLNGFLREVKYKSKFASLGLTYINRLLLYGASGTGKTYMTKALANHLGYTMIYIDIQQALTTGNAAGALASIFELANTIGQAIIFLDECDAISWDRSETDASDSNMRRANNALFQYVDQLNPECVFVAATNLYDHIDPAFKRRFDLEFRFDRPEIDRLDDSLKSMIIPNYFIVDDDMDPYIKDRILWYAKDWTSLSYDGVRTWVERAEKEAIIKADEEGASEVVLHMSDVWNYFMLDMDLAIGHNNKGLYLYKKG